MSLGRVDGTPAWRHRAHLLLIAAALPISRLRPRLTREETNLGMPEAPGRVCGSVSAAGFAFSIDRFKQSF